MTSENERRFREKLSILNENFLRFLQKAYSKNPDADFTPPIKDYSKHLRALDKMYYEDGEDGSAGNEAPTVTTSSTSTTTTTTSSAADSELSSSQNKGTPSLFASSTLANTTTSISDTSAGPKFLFGVGTSPATTAPATTVATGAASAGTPFVFGTTPTTTAAPVTTTTTAAATFPLLFGTQPKTTTTTAAAAPPSSVPTFSFGAAKFPSTAGTLFGSTTATALTTTFSSDASQTSKGAATDKGESDDEAAEEFVPTDTFKPIVPLPPKVDVKSGEEDEEVLFTARCKLFRFDAKEKKNKERGIGELKLLHNKETGRYRCVIRSDDQLSKLFANFPVLATMKSQVTHKPHFRTLQCRDFSESSDGIDEVFVLKFRDQTTAEGFANKLEETGKKLGEVSKETDKEA